MTCRHCHRKKANRPRGLCWHCYYAPGVKERYHPLGGARGVCGALGHEAQPPVACPSPTAALPGTPEKVAVMVGRARLRQHLFHPEDRSR